jgi:hypothetical protein
MTPMIAKIITVTVLTVGSNIQLPQILRPPADISGDISVGRFSLVATTEVKTHASAMLLRPGSRRRKVGDTEAARTVPSFDEKR